MSRDWTLYIKDILDSMARIEEFIGTMNFKQFVADEKTSSAVIQKLEVIGEASKNVPREIRNKYRHIPWSDMAKMRDKMAHFYFGIDYEVVWKVVKERLPGLKEQISEIIAK